MADEEILVKYRVDLSEFDAAIETVRTANTGVGAAAAQTQTSLNNLSGATGKLTDKVGALAAEEKKAAEAAAVLAKSQQDATKSATQLGNETKKTQGLLSRIGSGFKQFGLGARDGFRTAIKEVGGFSGIASQLGTKVKGIGATVTGAFKQVGSSVAGVAGQVPLIGGLATALGPVGIAAAAAATGLFKMFTNTDAGATAIQGLGKTAGVVFDRVTGVAKSLFDTITNGTGIIGKGFDLLTDAVDFFINKLTPIGDIFRALSETSLFKALKDDFEFGQQIANQLDELDDKQREVNLTVAQNEVGLRKNLAALRDTTKSVEERLAIADEITRVEQENLAQKKQLLRAELGILQAQAARQQATKGEVDDALKQQITDLNIAIANAEAESVSLTERVAVRRASIVEEEERRKAAARAKAIAAREKAEQEAARKAEVRAQAEAKLNETIEKLARESFERTLTDSEREVEAVKKKYADLEAATLEGIAKLREASPPNAQSEITRKEAEAIIAIEQARAAELAALTAAEREAALESIRQFTTSQTELEREAALQRYDELVSLAEQNIEDEAERALVIEELTRKTQEELTGIVTEEEQKRLDAQRSAAEQAIQLKEQVADAERNLGQAQIDAAAQAANTIAQLAGETEEAQVLSLIAQKGAAVANVIIQTQAGLAAAAAALAAVPPILPPGVPNPAYPAAIALNAAQVARLKVQAGTSIATILAQSIVGAYTGEERVGRNEAPQLPGTKDRYLRRVHKDEGIVDAQTNMEHLDAINAMRRGTFDQWVRENYMPLVGEDDRLVQYVNSDTGQRMAASLVLPRFFDKGIVGAVNGQRKQQQATNDLLAQLVNNTKPRRTNPRYN